MTMHVIPKLFAARSAIRSTPSTVALRHPDSGAHVKVELLSIVDIAFESVSAGKFRVVSEAWPGITFEEEGPFETWEALLKQFLPDLRFVEKSGDEFA